MLKCIEDYQNDRTKSLSRDGGNSKRLDEQTTEFLPTFAEIRPLHKPNGDTAQFATQQLATLSAEIRGHLSAAEPTHQQGNDASAAIGRPLTYGSLCTGLAGETVAWHPLDWRPSWFAEIDPFCSTLLNHHYPEVQNLGDLTRIEAVPPVDIIVGGTPCQSFSVNGRRGGLEDPRGKLTMHFFRLVAQARPRWVVWENVPGVLSSAGGADFREVLESLAKSGYGFAWRVLDLRSFGVPQRRRRLWLVGFRGDAGPAAEVLFAREHVAEVVGEDGEEGRSDSERDRGLGWGYVISGDCTPKVSSPWAPTLRSQQGGEGVVLWTADGPRRLTPLEYERLQGFPDGYTDVPFRGRPAPDTRRRRALGNAFAPPYLRWIGERIQRWEATA